MPLIRPLIAPLIRPLILQSRESRGVTILEYVLVVVFLGFTIYFVSLEFKPKSEAFYNDITPGLGVDYPVGFTDRS